MDRIIITGITNGLGKEILELLREKKQYKLYLLGRKLERVNGDKDNEFLYETDFTIITHEVLHKLLSDLSNHIRMDEEIIFINCAGKITPIDLLENIKDIELIENYNVNCLWPLLIIRGLVSITEEKKNFLRIINLSSGVIKNPLPGWSLYSSAKASVKVCLDTLVKEKSKYRIVSVDPGVMDTNMQACIRDVKENGTSFEYIDDFCDLKVKQMLLAPQKVAEIIVENYVANWKTLRTYEKVIDIMRL